MIAGVIAGIGARIGIDPTPLRAVFLVLVFVTGGLALLFYAFAWAVLPASGPPVALRRPASGPAVGRAWQLPVGVGLLTLAALLSFRELGIWWSDALVWPLVLGSSGLVVLWRQSRGWRGGGEGAAATAAAGVPPARPARSPVVDLYRGGFGIALVLGAALLFLSANDALGAARDAALTATVAIVALALILAPFLWRLGRNLAAERAERIRSQERAEMAAHVHDSVLQTLALMQKRAADPAEVAALARRQERELRAWMGGNGEAGADGLQAALRGAAEEVEDAHRVKIDAVIVGDRPLDERTAALCAAAREALTNAAKFSGGAPISLYAEIGDQEIEVFVHDRGPGFDPGAIPADRRGVRESILGRMERHGGSATVGPGAGGGTEVALRLGGVEAR